jgi:hypothetical protein
LEDRRPILISVSDTCPLGCCHCGLAREQEKADGEDERIRRRVRSAVLAGFDRIIFTGGEPFARLDLLRDCIQIAAAAGCRAGVFTNAYWAANPIRAYSVLSFLEGLTHLWVSVDGYHLEYIPLEYVAHAIAAARQRGLTQICLVASFGTDAERKNLVELIRRAGVEERIYCNPIIPTPKMGGKIQIDLQRIGDLDTQSHRGNCRINTPLIFFDGSVTMCHIGKIFCIDRAHGEPYWLGNADTSELNAIMKVARENQLYQFLRVSGPLGMLDILRESPFWARFKEIRVSCACHLCITLLADREFREYLTYELAQPAHQALTAIRQILFRMDPLCEGPGRPMAG